MNKQDYKIRVTKAVLEQLENKTPLEEAIHKWWVSPYSLRLSYIGNLEFLQAEIEYFDHIVNQKNVNKTYLKVLHDLSTKLTCPYYIDVTSTGKHFYIRLFESKVSMMVQLYGDIESYLKSVRVHKY